MLVDNEFLHRVERAIYDKVVRYIRNQREYPIAPMVYVNKRSGSVSLGDSRYWKNYGSAPACILCTTCDGHTVVDTGYIHKWVWKDIFAHCEIWK